MPSLQSSAENGEAVDRAPRGSNQLVQTQLATPLSLLSPVLHFCPLTLPLKYLTSASSSARAVLWGKLK